MMRVYLSFDVEVWCDGWNNLDSQFPASFDRYVYGRSAHGDYALPETLAILNRHGLKGVFFVEPLFATRFGKEHLETIVRLIRDAGHEVQLHLHPEWTDEAKEPIIKDCAAKRQHLSYYTLEEQTTLIAHGKKMLEAAGSGPISVFRSGSFAANRDTFEALRRNQIFLDTSLNRCYDVSAPDLRAEHSFDKAFVVQGVTTFPITVMKDGFGKDRPAQVGACGFGEMRDALRNAQRDGHHDFVVVSHNFEMLRPGSSAPDWIVVKRFERLCAFLAQHPNQFRVRGFGEDLRLLSANAQTPQVLRSTWFATSQRYLEQLQRQLRDKFRRRFDFQKPHPTNTLQTFEIDSNIAPPTPCSTSKSQRVRLKFLLGEFILTSWYPQLVVMTPRSFGGASWPPAPEQIATELPEGAVGFLFRKISAARFPIGIGRYGDFLLYVPHKDVLWTVQVQGSFEEYLKSFSPKARQNLTRSVHNFLKHNEVSSPFEIFSTPEEITKFHAEAAAISSQTYQSKMLDSGLPASTSFHAHMVSLAERGHARGYLLRDGVQAIAFAWCQLDEDRLIYSIVGYLPEHAKLSPGTVLLYLLLKDVFENNICRIVDFGPGEAQYKAAFATHREEFMDAYVLRRSPGTWLRIQAHYLLTRFSSASGSVLERWGIKKRIKALLRSLK